MDPMPEVKKLVIENEIKTWENTLYRAKLRHRVLEQVGAAPADLEEPKKEIARALAALDVCHEILAEVEAEIAAPNGKEPAQVGSE